MTKSSKSSRLLAARIAATIVRYLARSPAAVNSETLSGLAELMDTLGALLRFVANPRYRIGGIRIDDTLQIYCDLYSGKSDRGAIAKGWDDPGFRVLDTLYIRRRNRSRLKAKMYFIAEACASQGCCFQVREADGGGVELEIWTPIYGQRLESGTLNEALKALAACRSRVRKACPVSSGPE